MDAKMFGAFLARVRRAQGLTQAELAEQLHVTDKAVSRWERGVGLPDINTLESLADALGLSLADLMHCHDPAQEPPTAPVPLEDFFSMLRRRPVADWHSVRTALLRRLVRIFAAAVRFDACRVFQKCGGPQKLRDVHGAADFETL